MEQNSTGSDLLRTFHTIGINTNEINRSTIEAWFDTDCDDTKAILYWLCSNITKENVNTPQETEEYEHLQENNKVLTGNDYDSALGELQSKFPDILENTFNSFDVECKEIDIAAFIEERDHQECLITINKNLSYKLNQEMSQYIEEETKITIEKDVAESECVELHCQIDKKHEQLQQQIAKYGMYLNFFEFADVPKFLLNVSMDKYTQHFNSVAQNIETVIKCARKDINCSDDEDHFVDDFENLKNRISNSTQNCILTKMKVASLQKEFEFLNKLNLFKVISMYNNENSSRIRVETNVAFEQEQLKQLLPELDNMVEEFSNVIISRPKLQLAQRDISTNQKKHQLLQEHDKMITNILSNQMALFLLVEKEKSDIQSGERFFRTVYYYINHNVQDCRIRTDAMVNVINEYNVHKLLPIEHRCKLLSIITSLVSGEDDDDVTFTEACNIMKGFIHQCKTLEKQVLVPDITRTRQLEKEISIIRKFLSSGPTKQLVVMPHLLLDVFNRINDVLEDQKNSVMAAVTVKNEAMANLSKDKWLKLLRQLWIFFITDPKKLLFAIEQIENAVEQNRDETNIVL